MILGINQFWELYGSTDMARFCEACGAELKDGAKICEYCGTKVPQAAASEMNICPICGKEALEGAKYCRFCGKPLFDDAQSAALKAVEKSCPVCGAILPDGAKFCNKCGHLLSAGISRSGISSVTRQTKDLDNKKQPSQKRGKSFPVRAVALILAAAVLVTGLWKPGFMLPLFDRIGWFQPSAPKVD